MIGKRRSAMKLERVIVHKYFIVLIGIILSGTCIILTDMLAIHVLAMIVLTVISCSVVKFDLSHPYVWYSTFFTLYSISYPVTYLFGVNIIVDIYTKDLMILQWLALSTFIVVVTPKQEVLRKIKKTIDLSFFSRFYYVVLAPIIMITIVSLRNLDFNRKSDMYQISNSMVSIGLKLIIVFLLVYNLKIFDYAIKFKKLNISFVIATFFITTLLFFVSAERDLVFRFILITFYTYYIFLYEKKDKSKLIIAICLIVSLIPLITQFKYFGITGEIFNKQNNNFILNLMESEFTAASRNLQLLISNVETRGLMRGATYLNAIIKAIELPFLPELSDPSSVSWFNSFFFPGRSTGMGFSIVGDGYINFGYSGVVIMFIIIGLIVKQLYKYANKSIYNSVIYIQAIPIFIYSIRADLSSILSPLIRQVLIIFAFIYLVNKLTKGSSLKQSEITA